MVLFLHITSKPPGRGEGGLLSEKGGRGFPYLVFMDAEGTVLGQPGGRSVAAFQKTGDLLQKYVALKAQVATGGPEVKLDYCLVRAQLGMLSFDETKAELATLTVPEAQQARVDACLVNVEVADLVKKVQSRQVGPEAIGPRFYELLKAGKSPTDEGTRGIFYQVVLGEAEKAADAASFEAALVEVEKSLAGMKNPRVADFLAQKRATLDKLKAGGTPAPGGAEGGK